MTWMDDYLALRSRIAADPQFPALVRSYGGNPDAVVPTRRAGRLATRICERLDLPVAVYRGNVLGAAADACRARSTAAVR